MSKTLLHTLKSCIFGALVIVASSISVQGQVAFESDCNAYVGLRGHFQFHSEEDVRYYSDGQGNSTGFGSLFILPDIGFFVIGRRTANDRPLIASAPNFQKTLAQHFHFHAPKTDDHIDLANWTMNQFECVAQNNYFKTSLDTAVADITQKFEASEKRVKEVLYRGLSGQLSNLKGQIEALRREVPGLAQADREEMSKRLAVLEAQVEASTKEICLAVKQDAGQC